MSYIKEIAGLKMEIGEFTSYIDNMDVRTKVFTIEVVGLNKEHTHKTSEEYLTKLAMGLIYRLIENDRMDLVEKVIESLFEAGYTLAGYKAKLYKYHMLAMAEQGIATSDPLKTPNTSAHLP